MVLPIKGNQWNTSGGSLGFLNNNCRRTLTATTTSSKVAPATPTCDAVPNRENCWDAGPTRSSMSPIGSANGGHRARWTVFRARRREDEQKTTAASLNGEFAMAWRGEPEKGIRIFVLRQADGGLQIYRRRRTSRVWRPGTQPISDARRIRIRDP